MKQILNNYIIYQRRNLHDLNLNEWTNDFLSLSRLFADFNKVLITLDITNGFLKTNLNRFLNVE